MSQTIINFVLDKSSSMFSVTKPTVDGFNEFLHEQQRAEGDAWLSLTLFDTTFDVRYTAWGINDVPDMSLGHGENQYAPSGSTALLDAVGVTIRGTEKWLENNSGWFKGKVICAILTDGQENSSRQFNTEQINALIKEKQEQGWEFIFLGAGGSDWLEKTFHVVNADNFFAFNHDAVSNMATYGAMTRGVSAVRSGKSHSVAASVGSDQLYAGHRTDARAKAKPVAPVKSKQDSSQDVIDALSKSR